MNRKLNKPLIMGVLNLTPDSFYDGGRYNSPEEALRRARVMIDEGADIIDLGGESTRPGADPVSADEEKRRILPVLESLVQSTPVKLSVDTSKPEVARAALDLDVDVLNVVTGLESPKLMRLVRDYDCEVVIMHMQGSPRTMQENPKYDNVVRDVRDYLANRAEQARSVGVGSDQIILDPGIGFGKTLEHNRKLLTNLDTFKELGYPVMIGHSRKSFLGEVLGRSVENRETGTLAVSCYLMQQSVDLLRVHDVGANVEARTLYQWLYASQDEKSGDQNH